ncbi:hypothetical protein ACIQU6_43535 [Streptomyces sp. NPDC090442]|uniref:hypothetical protein n=1 Tax=Streptomyces sp. NPDC090442 TaxID=3365962 RepID=UPI00381B859B
MTKKAEKVEEVFAGASIEGRMAALKVAGAHDLVLPNGDKLPVHEAVFSAHRSRVITQNIRIELNRLEFPNYWGELFSTPSQAPGAQDSVWQFSNHKEAYEQTAWKCEGHFAQFTKLQKPFRLFYKAPITDLMELDSIVPIGQLGRSHYRLPQNDDGGGTFSFPGQVRNLQNIWRKFKPSNMPILFASHRRFLSVARVAESGCDLRTAEELDEVDIEDPKLPPADKAELLLWQQAWKETFEADGQAPLMTRLGREMTGLPGGRGVWSKAGWELPGTSILKGEELGAATRAVHAELTVEGKDLEPRLDEHKAPFGPGGGGATAEMTLAMLQAPGLLNDAFGKGTSALRRAADVVALNPRWFKPAAALYIADDILHGDFKGAAKTAAELGAWLSAFAMLELMGAGPVGWALAAVATVADLVEAKWKVDAARKAQAQPFVDWLDKEVTKDIQEAPKMLWGRVFDDMASAMGGETLRLESAAAHDAQVTLAHIDNLAALVLQVGGGFTKLDKAWWDALDEKISTAKWAEDRKGLYNDWLYGTPPSSPTDAQKRRVYCHLCVILYRQLRDASGTGLQALLAGLDTPSGITKPDFKDKTPRNGLETCYTSQLQTVEKLAEHITKVATTIAPTNAVANISTWLQAVHADFESGSHRINKVAQRQPGVGFERPLKKTEAETLYLKYGQHIYKDMFVYKPLNPKAETRLADARTKAQEKAGQRAGVDFRIAAGFERDWSVLSSGVSPFTKVDAALPVPGDRSRYYVFSRDPGSTSHGFYREIGQRDVAHFGHHPTNPTFVGVDGMTSSMIDVTLGSYWENTDRILFFGLPPSYRFKKGYYSSEPQALVARDVYNLSGSYFGGLRLNRGAGTTLHGVDAVMPDQVDKRFWFFEGDQYVYAEVVKHQRVTRLDAGKITSTTWPAFFGSTADGVTGDDYNKIDEVIRIPGTGDYYIFKGSTYRYITIPRGGSKSNQRSELIKGPRPIADWEGLIDFSPVRAAVNLELPTWFSVFGSDPTTIQTMQYIGRYPALVAGKGTIDINASTWPSLVSGSLPFHVVDAFLPADSSTPDYYVFSDRYFRRIRLGENTPVTPSTTIASGWPSFSQGGDPSFDSVDAVLAVPGAEKEFYVFSKQRFRRIKLNKDTNTLIAGPGSIDQGLLWPELAHAGFTTVDAFLPDVEKPHTLHAFSGNKTVKVGYEPDNTADLIGLHCWALQEGLLDALLKPYLDITAPASRQPSRESQSDPRCLKNLGDDPVVEAARRALRALWNPGKWNFKGTDFGNESGIDPTKMRTKLERFFPQSVRTALLTPAVAGELPKQLAQDASDIINAPANRDTLRETRAKDAVERLETALNNWQTALKDVLAAGETADQYYDDANEQDWDNPTWATARVQEWTDFHDKLSTAWAYVEKTGGTLGPGIFTAADNLANPDAGALATALGTQLQDTLPQLHQQSTDIRAIKPS